MQSLCTFYCFTAKLSPNCTNLHDFANKGYNGSNKVWKEGAIPPKVYSGLSSIQIFKTVQFLVVPRLNLWFCFSIACKMFENRHTTRMQGSFVACNCLVRLLKIICNVAFDFPFLSIFSNPKFRIGSCWKN